MIFSKLFCRSAGIILATTGFAKICSSFGDSEVLRVHDPIIGISFGHLMMVSGIAEILIACICLFSRSFMTVAAIVAFISINLSLYRVGLWWIGWRRPCKCLGNLTDALHISPQTADAAMKVILAYLLIGSFALLLWFWRQHKRAAVVSN